VTNTRLLGTLCIVGALVGMADGLRKVILGTPLTPGLQTLDTFSMAAIALTAAGGVCGVLGLVALRATGSRPLFRFLTYLPAVSYTAGVVSGLGMLSGVLTNDAQSGATLVLVFAYEILGPAAWLVVGILTIAAKEWSGWRRLVPLAQILAFPLAIAAATLTGFVGTFALVQFTALATLGYVVRSTAAGSRLRPAEAQLGTAC
jgi:hypothetical protein